MTSVSTPVGAEHLAANPLRELKAARETGLGPNHGAAVMSVSPDNIERGLDSSQRTVWTPLHDRELIGHRQLDGTFSMTIHVVAFQPLIALIAGILILLVPRFLNYVVAIYLILIGLFGLFPNLVR
jgi:hypothetical protein